MKKISEVEPIEYTGTEELTKDNLTSFIEEPLVLAARELYEKNILTFMSSANRKNVGNRSHLSIYYDKLSDENKRRIDEMAKESPENFEFEDTLLTDPETLGEEKMMRLVSIQYPVTESTTVEEIEQFYLQVAQQLEIQEICCFRFGKGDTVGQYIYFQNGYWLYLSDRMDIKQKIDEQDSDNPSYVYDDVEYDYETSKSWLIENEGYAYSEDEGVLYHSRELYDRHMKYVEYMAQKESQPKQSEGKMSIADIKKAIAEKLQGRE